VVAAIGIDAPEGSKVDERALAQCERKVLVIILIDAAIGAITAGTETDRPKEDGFDEVWLADYTQVEAFGSVDLFAIVHSKLEGRFATGDYGQKPFG
jgi:hypothetical protein